MSDKTDDSNELDNYGVWVKKPPREIESESAQSDNSINELDLPDFGDFDAAISSEGDEDLFNDLDFTSTAEDLQEDSDNSFESGDTSLSPDELANISVSDTPEEPSFDEDDTTLNPDELANITMGQDTEAVQEESAADDMDFAESAALSNAFFSDDSLDEDPFTEPSTENISDDTDISDSDPDFSLDAPIEEPVIDDTVVSEETSEPSADDFADGDVDLGSFMSDSSGGDEFSFEDGDIDLGDFMGEGFGGGASKEPAEINDEQTLDINVDFDEDAASIAMEDVPESAPAPAAANSLNTTLDPNGAAEEMFNSFDAAVAASGIPEPAQDSASSTSTESDEIDLSEFGFDDDDSNIGMTNGPDGANPVKKEVVDYDMKVAVDGDSKTPPVLDVINGKISSQDSDYDFEEDETTNTMGTTSSNTVSPEISEKGKEILEQIMGELVSLKDEIKNIKNEFAELQTRPVTSASNEAADPTRGMPVQEDDDNSGFFGADDGDDTIALSGTEMSNILNSAEFSEEPSATEDSASMEEPQIEESSEPEMEETAISDDELNIEDPTIASVTGDIVQSTGLAESDLPDEISIPKREGFNNDAIDDFMADDASIEDSLTEDKLNYLGESPAMEDTEQSNLDVGEIVKENISMQDDDEAGIGIGSDIDAAFDEADAAESDIMDNSLDEKDSYEDSVSGIMKENISMQEGDEAGIGIGSDIDTAFNEADAAESDIMDDSLAAKDAYEKEINKSIDSDDEQPTEDPIGDSLDEPTLEDPLSSMEMDEPEIEEPVFDDTMEETSVDDHSIEETVVEAPLVEEPMSADFEESEVEEHVTTEATTSSMPKDLKKEIVSVLSYMDQLLENLPEDKITEFAKSEHFVTYKKLFDELGLA